MVRGLFNLEKCGGTKCGVGIVGGAAIRILSKNDYSTAKMSHNITKKPSIDALTTTRTIIGQTPKV
jgi:hypothetical protein